MTNLEIFLLKAPVSHFEHLIVEPIPAPIDYKGGIKDAHWYSAVGKTINYHEERRNG